MYYIFDVPTYEYKGESMVPTPHCTEVEPPPIHEHQCLIWVGNKWEIHPDYRGTPYWSEFGMYQGEYGCIGLIPSDFILKRPPEIRIGEHVLWNKKRDDWDVFLDEGYIYDETHTPRPMTPAERVIYGLDPLPPDMKIEGDNVVPKTPYELYDDGLVSLEEANNMISYIREEQYTVHTDKYGMMYMRGEVTLEFWQEEIQKVKDKYPYIEVIDG